MKALSLFTGIGGFELGLEAVGIKTVLQVENNKFCLQLLNDKWPEVEKIEDIRRLLEPEHKPRPVDIICGGDPCQCRSIAKGGRRGSSPDMSGYFLAVVGRYGSRWVVRENVPASDAINFAIGLEYLGYRTITVELNARDFTSQNRRRQFIIGGPRTSVSQIEGLLSERQGDSGNPSQNIKKSRKAYTSCITSHCSRISEGSTLIYEDGMGLRHLTEREAERLQGFPTDWTDGFSRYRRHVMLGNAVPPPMVKWIAERILEADNENI